MLREKPSRTLMNDAYHSSLVEEEIDSHID